MQATIVALYGEKPVDLSALLTQCQDAAEEILGSRFRRYEIEQVHATLVGLERDEQRTELFLNRNYKVHERAEVQMDFCGLIDYLRTVCDTPFRVQIGGFQDRDYPFTSRGSRPFNRSFSIQGGNVVVIGWPRRCIPPSGHMSSPSTEIEDATLYPDILDRIRRGAEHFGVLHAYYRRPGDADNDLYFRIGVVDDPGILDTRTREGVHRAVRRILGARSPVVVTIDTSRLFLAFYETEELPRASTRAYALADGRLDDVFIHEGYSLGVKA